MRIVFLFRQVKVQSPPVWCPGFVVTHFMPLSTLVVIVTVPVDRLHARMACQTVAAQYLCCHAMIPIVPAHLLQSHLLYLCTNQVFSRPHNMLLQVYHVLTLLFR